MPVVRQPLRQRCNVQLSVVTCVSDNTYISKDESHIRGRSRTCHKRKTAAKKRKFGSTHPSSAPAYLKGEVAVTIPSPLPLSRSRGNHHLQSYCELIPFLSIALSDGLFDPTTLLPPTTSESFIPFTHFITIQYATPLLNPGLAWSEYHLKTGISVLNLVVPTTRQSELEQTLLTEHQLLLSRDFLSLALPYYSRFQPPIWASNDLPSADMAHVLITAPPGSVGCIGSSSSSVVDVMSIVVCYLTFAGGEETATVVECVDGEVDAFELGLADVWKGKVKGGGVEVIQKVAMAP